MEKKWKGFSISSCLFTLYSLKWWHQLEPHIALTSYGTWQQLKWHFIIVLNTSVCQTRLTQKMLARGVLIWVHGKGFDLSDLTVKTAVLTHLSFGHFLQKKHSQAFSHRPNIGQEKRFQLIPTWARLQTESKHGGIWKKPLISAVSLRASSILSLWCF